MTDAAPPNATSGDADPGFDALWDNVLSRWDDPKSHSAFLEYAIARQALPAAAARYRALRDDPDKGEGAAKRLEGIAAAATSLLMATATPKRRKPPTWITALAFAVSFGLLFWLARALLGASR